jgi:hypothetical protein
VKSITTNFWNTRKVHAFILGRKKFRVILANMDRVDCLAGILQAFVKLGFCGQLQNHCLTSGVPVKKIGV